MESFKKAICNVWMESEINHIETCLGYLKLQLIVYIAVTLVYVGSSQPLKALKHLILTMKDC